MLADSLDSSAAYSNSYLGKSNSFDDSNMNSPCIIFTTSKKDIFTPNNGLKIMLKRLRANFKVSLWKEEFTSKKLNNVQVIILAAPRETFSSIEFAALKNHLDRGGSILYMGTEGGEVETKTNFNYMLEEFGISVNSDAVMRSSYYKYFHPKEVFVSNGVINREINRLAQKDIESDPLLKSAFSRMITLGRNGIHDKTQYSALNLSIVYPFGASLSVEKPAIPVIASGQTSYPLNRPIAAVYQHKGKGKLFVLGSCHVFHDTYITKEENGKLLDSIMQYLTDENSLLNTIDAEDPDVSDYHYVPNTAKFSETLKSCLQESEDIPKDFRTMFDLSLFKFSMSLYPKVLKLYKEMKVKPGPLTLIEPQFQTPLPPLSLAIFPPTFRSLPPPSLELFDLDEEFSPQESQLAQLANKCTNEDAEYFIMEAADILNIKNNSQQDVKMILEATLNQIIKWKKSDL